MRWHLYKKDNPSTWPKIDCPMVVHWSYKQYNDSDHIIFIGRWDNDKKQFYTPKKWWSEAELYYAYIGYIPSGYKTHHPIICTCDNCPEGYDDNGYCMDYDNEYACGCKQEIEEYSIEEKRIWRGFE